MQFERLLITGGAGFVGSNLAILFQHRFPDLSVVAADNLKRRGSELNLSRLRQAGVAFEHVDIRVVDDLDNLVDFDLLIDCAAEPSVQSGTTGSPRYVLDTNLNGTINCLEAARRREAAFLFLSTSRVYPISQLNSLPFTEHESRFRWDAVDDISGFSEQGIAETFSLDGPRSFYGASKLSGELLIQEYVFNSGLRALINRCGILAGPWQMGKVDQGVVTLWAARHHFGKPLKYLGFGGRGKQVRDMLHIEDLFDLLCRQMASPQLWDGRVYNVGGGNDVSSSLNELTTICREVTGNSVDITPEPETSDVDLRIYVTDAQQVSSEFDWSPRRTVRSIVEDIHAWLVAHHEDLTNILG